MEFLGTIMFIWFFLCLCNFYRFFCNLIEVPTVQNCCTFWILLIFPEGINKLYYSSKFNKTLSWSNWSAAPLISLPKLKVAGSSLCGAHIFLHIKMSGMSLGSPCFIQLKDSKLIPFHIFFFQSSNKKQMRWGSQLMPPGQWSSSFIQWLGSRNRTASSTWTHIVSKQNLLVAKGSTTVIFH